MGQFKFKIKGDVKQISNALDEFIEKAYPEIDKSKAVKVWKKVSKRVGLPPPLFVFSYDKKKDYVLFYVKSSYPMRTILRAKGKMIKNLDGFLTAKNVNFKSIEMVK